MSKNILVVDDSESIRELLYMTLSPIGYNVSMGSDGEEALKILDKNEIDLIITDLNMPNMDGITLIKEVRKNPRFQFTPILFLTTESLLSKKEEAKAAGATG